MASREEIQEFRYYLYLKDDEYKIIKKIIMMTKEMYSWMPCHLGWTVGREILFVYNAFLGILA